MSKENVEILRALIPAPEVNIAELVGRSDDEMLTLWRQLAEPLIHEDAEFRLLAVGARTRYEGIDGLREAWLSWVEPWASYRTEVEELVDLGDRVLAVVRDYGRRDEMTTEVMLRGASI